MILHEEERGRGGRRKGEGGRKEEGVVDLLLCVSLSLIWKRRRKREEKVWHSSTRSRLHLHALKRPSSSSEN